MLLQSFFAQDRGEPYDEHKFEATMKHAVEDAVAHQSKAGVDIMSDGEMSKISYATYIRHRFNGFETGRTVPRATPADSRRFPRLSATKLAVKERPFSSISSPICTGPLDREKRWSRSIKTSRARRRRSRIPDRDRRIS